MSKSFIFLWAAVVVLILFFWIYFPTLSHYRELKLEQETMDKQIVTLEKKIRDLEEEKQLLQKDPEYLEKVIRDELGLVKPGEIVYKFVPEKSDAKKIPAPSPAKVAVPISSARKTQ